MANEVSASASKSARVFLSSTVYDLKAERDGVAAALQAAGFEVVRSEDFLNDGEESLSKCLAELETCGLVVLIIGHRYGSYSPEAAASVTEAEFWHAIDRQIPVLVYVKDSFDNGVADSDESEALKASLRRFKTEVEWLEYVERPYYESTEMLVRKAVNACKRIRDHGVKRPTFGGREGTVGNRRPYVFARAKRRLHEAYPYPVWLVIVDKLNERRLPPPKGHVLVKKLHQVMDVLGDGPIPVVPFNDFPAESSSVNEVRDVRLAVMHDSAELICCFVRDEHDLAELAKFEGIRSSIAVWARNGLEPPTGMPFKYWYDYSPSELKLCSVSESAIEFIVEAAERHAFTRQGNVDVKHQ